MDHFANMAVLTNGNIVVTWADNAATRVVHYRLYDPSLTPVTGVLDVTSPVAGRSIQAPDVAALTGGGFAITFQLQFTPPTDTDIYAQRFTAAGVADGANIPINTAVSLDLAPSIAGLADGGFAIAHHRVNGANTEVWHAIRNADGTQRLADTLFDATGTVNSNVDVEPTSAGGYSVNYIDNGWGGGNNDVTFWSFTAAGANADIRQVSASAANDSQVNAAVSASGFTVSTFNNAGDINGTLVSPTGTVFAINSVLDGSTGSQSLPAPTWTDASHVAFIETVDATAPGNDGNGTGVASRIVELRRVTTGDAAADTITLTTDAIVNVVNSGDGDDIVTTGVAADQLNGGNGNDQLIAGAGNDTLNGDAGNDTLEGNTGNDTINGGDGDDLIIWRNGDGTDTVDGGAGTDTQRLIMSDTDGDVATLTATGANAVFARTNLVPFQVTTSNAEKIDFQGQGGGDSLSFGSLAGTSVTQVLFSGGAGDDTLNAGTTTTAISADGGSGNDFIFAGSGNDTILGGDGLDKLFGGDGNDTITDDTGASSEMNGEAGNDTIYGGPGNDYITGGDGDDIISGGTDGQDSLFGGAGNATSSRPTPTVTGSARCSTAAPARTSSTHWSGTATTTRSAARAPISSRPGPVRTTSSAMAGTTRSWPAPVLTTYTAMPATTSSTPTIS